jgi:hypothetical protein
VEERGYDAGKTITGRKRHVAVDTLGLLLTIVVHGGYWQDHDGACLVLMQLQERFRRLKLVFADSAYDRNDLPNWLREKFGWVLQPRFDRSESKASSWSPSGGSSNALSPGSSAAGGTPKTMNANPTTAKLSSTSP